MSRWSQKRKRRYLTMIGLVFFFMIIVIAFQYFNQEASCFDGIMNGQETGIDCGGSCQIVCREEARNLVVWWERPFRVAPGVYNALAYFENQNVESGIRELFYEFRLYDRNNVLITEPVIGSTFIEPNKRSAIFASGIRTGESEAYTTFFRITGVRDWEKTDQAFSYSLFKVAEPVLTEQETSPKLSALVENISYFDFTDVPVIAIVYNQEDNAIAASRTYIDRLDQGEEQTAYFSWPEPFAEAVARIEIIPRVNPFSSF